MTDDEVRKALDFLRYNLAQKGIPKVLIVEDDQRDLALLMGNLCKFNCDTYVAETAPEAIELIDAHRPDLVLLDLKLPIVPGVEVIKERQNLDPNLYFVVVTGVKNSPDLDEALRTGRVTAVLEKPVKDSDLERILSLKQPSTLMHDD